MADPVPLVCPFDGYATPILEPGDNANDGTPTWRVICPVCGIQSTSLSSKQAAADSWNRRRTLTYVTWEALIATFVATVPTMAALSAYVIAHPPVAD
jgi:hypothetical protein